MGALALSSVASARVELLSAERERERWYMSVLNPARALVKGKFIMVVGESC